MFCLQENDPAASGDPCEKKNNSINFRKKKTKLKLYKITKESTFECRNQKDNAKKYIKKELKIEKTIQNE